MVFSRLTLGEGDMVTYLTAPLPLYLDKITPTAPHSLYQAHLPTEMLPLSRLPTESVDMVPSAQGPEPDLLSLYRRNRSRSLLCSGPARREICLLSLRKKSDSLLPFPPRKRLHLSPPHDRPLNTEPMDHRLLAGRKNHHASLLSMRMPRPSSLRSQKK